MNILNGVVFNVKNYSFFSRSSTKFLGPIPEIDFTVSRTGERSTVKVINIGQENIYQLELYLYEDGMNNETLNPAVIGSEKGILRPGETYRFTQGELYFDNCIAIQQYWIEYEASNGNKFRFIYQVSASGKTRTFPPILIKKRTFVLSKTIKKKNWWTHLKYFLRHPSSLKYHYYGWKMNR